MTHWGRIFRDLNDRPIVGKGANYFKLEGLANTATAGITIPLYESSTAMGYYYTDKVTVSGIYTLKYRVGSGYGYYQRYLEPGEDKCLITILAEAQTDPNGEYYNPFFGKVFRDQNGDPITGRGDSYYALNPKNDSAVGYGNFSQMDSFSGDLSEWGTPSSGSSWTINASDELEAIATDSSPEYKLLEYTNLTPLTIGESYSITFKAKISDNTNFHFGCKLFGINFAMDENGNFIIHHGRTNKQITLQTDTYCIWTLHVLPNGEINWYVQDGSNGLVLIDTVHAFLDSDSFYFRIDDNTTTTTTFDSLTIYDTVGDFMNKEIPLKESTTEPGFYYTPKNYIGPVHKKESVGEYDNFVSFFSFANKWTSESSYYDNPCSFNIANNMFDIEFTGVTNEGARFDLVASNTFNNTKQYYRLRVMSTDVLTSSYSIWLHNTRYYTNSGGTYRAYVGDVNPYTEFTTVTATDNIWDLWEWFISENGEVKWYINKELALTHDISNKDTYTCPCRIESNNDGTYHDYYSDFVFYDFALNEYRSFPDYGRWSLYQGDVELPDQGNGFAIVPVS